MLSFKIFDHDETLENVTITAQAADGPLSVTIPIGNDCLLKSGKLVHQMAARRQIQDLEEENSEYVPDEVKEEISDIALKYGIASKYTSFVGVDKKTRKSVLEPAMSTRQIQQEVPRGFGFGGRVPLYFEQCSMSSPPMAFSICDSMSTVGSLNRSQSAKLKCKSSARSQLKFKMRSAAPQKSLLSEPYDVAKMDGAPNLHLNSSSSDFSETSDFEDLPSRKVQKDSLSKEDALTKLIHLQTANGSFKFGQILQELIGMTENQLMEKVQESEPEDVWITAVALALLEKKFSEDKELWELIANKAKTFIQKHTKSNFDEIMKKVATILI
jgi:hypothetical protein